PPPRLQLEVAALDVAVPGGEAAADAGLGGGAAAGHRAVPRAVEPGGVDRLGCGGKDGVDVDGLGRHARSLGWVGTVPSARAFVQRLASPDRIVWARIRATAGPLLRCAIMRALAATALLIAISTVAHAAGR